MHVMYIVEGIASRSRWPAGDSETAQAGRPAPPVAFARVQQFHKRTSPPQVSVHPCVLCLRFVDLSHRAASTRFSSSKLRLPQGRRAPLCHSRSCEPFNPWYRPSCQPLQSLIAAIMRTGGVRQSPSKKRSQIPFVGKAGAGDGPCRPSLLMLQKNSLPSFA